MDREPLPVIIDCDTGVDDALALMLALNSPELSTALITVTGGNVGVEQCALNTARIVNFVCGERPGLEPPPVALGRPAPGALDAAEVHADDGLGGVSESLAFPGEERAVAPDAVPPVQALLRDAAARGRKLNIITTGPMTNAAHWVRTMPDLVRDGVERITAMGGAFFTAGNVTPAAEFNIFMNPEAAAEVAAFCERTRIPLTFVGLDVTHRAILTRARLREFAHNHPGNRSVRLMHDMIGPYMDFHQRTEGYDGCPLHDPLAVGVAAEPGFCRIEPMSVRIETRDPENRGRTTAAAAEPGVEPATRVCLELDAAGFERFFLQRCLMEDV